MLEGKNREIANTSMAKDCWRWWTRRPRIDWFNMIVKSLIHYELEKKTKDCWREPTRRLTLGINLCIECKSEITELGLCTSSHVFYHCDERLIGPTMNLVTNLNSTSTLYGVNTTIVDFGFVRKEEEKEETPVAFECCGDAVENVSRPCCSPKSLSTIAHVRCTSPPPEITIALCLMDSSFLEDPHPISPHLRPTSHATASATAAAASSRF
ncbi:unnamed protein product [Camellia sinensis]